MVTGTLSSSVWTLLAVTAANMTSLAIGVQLALLSCLLAFGLAIPSEPLAEELGIGKKHSWALLAAGSFEYYNYRHQADICHAYQLLLQKGFLADNIIVMMYDDIAYSSENPRQGSIINRPNGPNVYEGVKIDYTRDDVTAANFLSVLAGRSEDVKNVGTGRVIKSGPHDHIFVYYADHGAEGYLLFPDDELHASNLIETLKSMHDQKLYKKMVLYIEACEAGSMFLNLLPDDLNIYAMTASNAEESSYGCYYDAELNAYLGDVFSVKWMENSDSSNLRWETINHQYGVVKKETNTSHVEEYGDLRLRFSRLSSFQGSSSKKSLGTEALPPITDAVPSREVPLEILKTKLAAAQDEKTRTKLTAELQNLLERRAQVDDTIARLAGHVASEHHGKKSGLLKRQHKLTTSTLSCYEAMVKHFSKKCFSVTKNPYVGYKMYVFVNMCSEPWVSEHAALEAIDKTCEGMPRLTGIL